MSLGLLVYGDNHLILRGPRPVGGEAGELAAHFGLSVARIASQLDRSGKFRSWQISLREFREDLVWVAEVPTCTPHSAAVSQLLEELAARGIVSD